MKKRAIKMKWRLSFWAVMMIIVGLAGMGWAGHEHKPSTTSSGHGGHGSGSDHEAMKHGSMDQGAMGGAFIHEAVVDGVRAEFQVMSLAAMKMTDPEGNTHHVMAKFYEQNSKAQIKEAVGRIKVIAPSGKEQVADLKDYSGIFAANFAVEEKGKYGIICLFKVGDKKRVAKFWYEHGG